MTHLVLEAEGRMATPPKLRTKLRSTFIVLRAVSLALMCVIRATVKQSRVSRRFVYTLFLGYSKSMNK